MTDEPDAPHADPDAEAVRRLLADARHTGPMPDDVADRMDAVLADLAGSPVGPEEPGGAPTPATVVSLTSQRRHRAAGMLVAAAAIVVGGVVVAQHLPGSSSQSNPPAPTAARRTLWTQRAAGRRVRPDAPQANRGDLTAGAAQIRGGRLLVRPQHFTADALAGRRVLESRTPPSAYEALSQVRVVLWRPPAPAASASARRTRALRPSWSSMLPGAPLRSSTCTCAGPATRSARPPSRARRPPGAAASQRESRSPTICCSQWSRSLAGGPTEPPSGTQEHPCRSPP